MLQLFSNFTRWKDSASRLRWSHDVWTRRCMQIDRDFRRRQQDLLRRPPPIVGAAITSRSTLTCCLLSNSRCQQDVAGGLSTWWWCVRGEKKIFLFFDGRASSSLTGNTSKRNTYYIHTYSLLYSITCLPYLVVTALQSNFIVRISDSKKTHNNCQHKAPRATLQQGPATQNSTQRTQSTAETHQFILLCCESTHLSDNTPRRYARILCQTLRSSCFTRSS